MKDDAYIVVKAENIDGVRSEKTYYTGTYFTQDKGQAQLYTRDEAIDKAKELRGKGYVLLVVNATYVMKKRSKEERGVKQRKSMHQIATELTQNSKCHRLLKVYKKAQLALSKEVAPYQGKSSHAIPGPIARKIAELWKVKDRAKKELDEFIEKYMGE